MKFHIHTYRALAAFIWCLVALTYISHGLAAATVVLGGSELAFRSVVGRPNYIKPGMLCVWSGVSLAEIFIPQIYGDIQPNDTIELTAFAQSGVAVTNPLLKAAAMSGAKTIDVPFWNDLSTSAEPNYSDDTDTVSTPDKVNTGDWKARNAYLNKSYGAADLAVEIGNSTPGQGDPMTRIRNRFGSYWARQFQYRLIAIAQGIMAKNILTYASDMINAINLETTVGQTAANMISANAIIDAVFTMGDAFENLAAIAMHSVPYKTLVKNDLIEFQQDSSGALNKPVYLGKQVIVDDGLPVRAGTTSGLVYTTVLFGKAAIGYGEGQPKVPFEMFRRPNAGSGGGNEDIYERRTWMIHPAGWHWTDTTVTAPGNSATLANLRLAANWLRPVGVVRKQQPMAFLLTNG